MINTAETRLLYSSAIQRVSSIVLTAWEQKQGTWAAHIGRRLETKAPTHALRCCRSSLLHKRTVADNQFNGRHAAAACTQSKAAQHSGQLHAGSSTTQSYLQSQVAKMTTRTACRSRGRVGAAPDPQAPKRSGNSHNTGTLATTIRQTTSHAKVATMR